MALRYLWFKKVYLWMRGQKTSKELCIFIIIFNQNILPLQLNVRALDFTERYRFDSYERYRNNVARINVLLIASVCYHRNVQIRESFIGFIMQKLKNGVKPLRKANFNAQVLEWKTSLSQKQVRSNSSVGVRVSLWVHLYIITVSI